MKTIKRYVLSKGVGKQILTLPNNSEVLTTECINDEIHMFVLIHCDEEETTDLEIYTFNNNDSIEDELASLMSLIKTVFDSDGVAWHLFLKHQKYIR
jgi:hypothetical protein